MIIGKRIKSSFIRLFFILPLFLLSCSKEEDTSPTFEDYFHEDVASIQIELMDSKVGEGEQEKFKEILFSAASISGKSRNDANAEIYRVQQMIKNYKLYSNTDSYSTYLSDLVNSIDLFMKRDNTATSDANYKMQVNRLISDILLGLRSYLMDVNSKS